MDESKSNSDKATPILRWAGGKNWLIKHLPGLIPRNFKNYHEPFLGGGSIFLSINPARRSFLSDANHDLISTYLSLKKSPHQIIKELKQYRNTEEFYYSIREKQFTNPFASAARFIFLNQTSFNGIYRVNLKGIYNVPYGHRTKHFLDENALITVSQRLKNADLFCDDFEIVKKNIKKNDLVFLDPPYVVAHNGNGFIKYNQKLFSLNDQYRLSSLIDHIKSKGAYYILTNAAHHKIMEIFSKDDRAIEFARASLIGGLNAQRGQTSEYVFTNVG
jgi:DNA adenine methylase